MNAYTYIEDKGQTYLQCQMAVKTFSRSTLEIFRENNIYYKISMGIDKLYMIPSRSKDLIEEVVYKEVFNIIIN